MLKSTSGTLESKVGRTGTLERSRLVDEGSFEAQRFLLAVPGAKYHFFWPLSTDLNAVNPRGIYSSDVLTAATLGTVPKIKSTELGPPNFQWNSWEFEAAGYQNPSDPLNYFDLQPEVSPAAWRRLKQDRELRVLVVEMGHLVDRHVGRWVSGSAIEIMQTYEDPDEWVILVVRYLTLTVERVVELSLSIGIEVADSLEKDSGFWQSSKWMHVSYRLEVV